MRSAFLALAILLTGLTPGARAATLDGLAVEVTNGSEPVLCAEKDNVTVNLASSEVRRFRIEAQHPAYIGMMREDRVAPNWTACEDISAATSEVPPPRKVTFYEDVEVWLTGYSFQNFWRDKDVPVRVGNRVEHGLHLIQVWVRRNSRAEEVMVLYPADGYWRIRPLPPEHLGWSAYGSSFLVGPVETEGRPLVSLKEVAFDPKTMTFTVAFDRGGSAVLKVSDLSREKLTLDVTFDRAVEGRPFATLRSMYVTETNADVARVAIRDAGAKSWREDRIMTFGPGRATDVWTGRVVPSLHNTSAPDMVFSRFMAAP